MQERHITTPGPCWTNTASSRPAIRNGPFVLTAAQISKPRSTASRNGTSIRCPTAKSVSSLHMAMPLMRASVAVMLFNFKTGEVIANISKLLALPFGSLHLPENAEQDSDICYDKGGVHLRFKVEGDTRYLSFSAPDFEANITLERKTPYSLVIHIPLMNTKQRSIITTRSTA